MIIMIMIMLLIKYNPNDIIWYICCLYEILKIEMCKTLTFRMDQGQM